VPSSRSAGRFCRCCCCGGRTPAHDWSAGGRDDFHDSLVFTGNAVDFELFATRFEFRGILRLACFPRIKNAFRPSLDFLAAFDFPTRSRTSISSVSLFARPFIESFVNVLRSFFVAHYFDSNSTVNVFSPGTIPTRIYLIAITYRILYTFDTRNGNETIYLAVRYRSDYTCRVGLYFTRERRLQRTYV